MKALVITSSNDIVQTISLSIGLRWPEATLLSVTGGSRGTELVETELPDIVILDLDLPTGSSFEVLAEVRLFSDVPIVVLTAADSEMDKVRALEMGADECIGKPFSPLDFLARVKALLRRAGMPELKQGSRSPFVSGNLTINFATYEVFVSGDLVHLTPTEFNLLCYLVRNQGRVLSHDTLLEKLWGSEYVGDRSLLKKYMSRLRIKLDANSSGASGAILSTRGVGYKFLSR